MCEDTIFLQFRQPWNFLFRTRDKNKLNTIYSHTHTYIYTCQRTCAARDMTHQKKNKKKLTIYSNGISVIHERYVCAYVCLHSQIVWLRMAIVFSWFTTIHLHCSVCSLLFLRDLCMLRIYNTMLKISRENYKQHTFNEIKQIEIEVMEHLLHVKHKFMPNYFI